MKAYTPEELLELWQKINENTAPENTLIEKIRAMNEYLKKNPPDESVFSASKKTSKKPLF